MARQADRQDVPATRQREVPSLLFLFHRRALGVVLSARADLVPVPAAVLLQWALLARQRTPATKHRSSHARQFLLLDRELRSSPRNRRRSAHPNLAPQTRCFCSSLRSGDRRLGRYLPLE